MEILKVHYFITFAGCWALGNGILHDIFVLREGRPSSAYLISIVVAIFVLGYCALIFKLLPSVGMILINGIALLWLAVDYLKVIK